uniref:Uncharacterized protein n=1 Tax=Dunaliella tertiolecta TaxID=3047 RepID=A0A7S3QMP5_DUNTE
MGCSSSQPLCEDNDTEEQRFSDAVLKQQVASPATAQQLGRERPAEKELNKPERRAGLVESLPKGGKHEPYGANSHSHSPSECTPPRSTSEEGGVAVEMVMQQQQQQQQASSPRHTCCSWSGGSMLPGGVANMWGGAP